jgi:Na+-driven multidrug efflux pump
MTGGERTVLGLTIGSLVLNILGNAALIPVLGISGAAVATVAASLFVALTCLVMLIGSRRLSFSFAWLRDILLGTAASFLVCALLTQALGTSSILSVALVLVVAYATYGIVVIATRTVEDEVVSVLQTPFLRALDRVR